MYVVGTVRRSAVSSFEDGEEGFPVVDRDGIVEAVIFTENPFSHFVVSSGEGEGNFAKGGRKEGRREKEGESLEGFDRRGREGKKKKKKKKKARKT